MLAAIGPEAKEALPEIEHELTARGSGAEALRAAAAEAYRAVTGKDPPKD
jgi:hypothetical protein